jgi:hypothetical protein
VGRAPDEAPRASFRFLRAAGAGYLLERRFEVVARGALARHEPEAALLLFRTARALGARSIDGHATAWQLPILLDLGVQVARSNPVALRSPSGEVRSRFRVGDCLWTGLEAEARF